MNPINNKIGWMNRNSLPEGWIRAKLQDIADRINPGFPSGKHNNENVGIPHIRPHNIDFAGNIVLSGVKYVEVNTFDRLLKGDVLFNNTNSPDLVGKTAYIKSDTNWAYSNHMTRLRFNTKFINGRWIAYVLHILFLQGFFKMNCSHHVNQASISSRFLSEKVITPLPPLQEQNRIVTKLDVIFSRLDDAISSLKKTNLLFKQYHISVLKNAFEGKLSQKWRQAFGNGVESAAQTLAKISQTRKHTQDNHSKLRSMGLLPLPSNWIWITIGDITESMKNGIYKPSRFYTDNGIACLRMYNIENGSIIWKNIRRMNLSSEEFLEYELMPGDILVNRVNSRELVGKAAVIPSGLEPCVYEAMNIRLRIISEYVDSKFVSLWFQFFSRAYFSLIAPQTVGMASVNQEQLSSMPIPLTSVEEQKIIVEEIERHFLLISHNMKNIDLFLYDADRLRHSLLRDAYEGKIAAQNSNDEHAEILLQRVKQETSVRNDTRAKQMKLI